MKAKRARRRELYLAIARDIHAQELADATMSRRRQQDERRRERAQLRAALAERTPQLDDEPTPTPDGLRRGAQWCAFMRGLRRPELGEGEL